jgi:hypothetical protein
MVYCSAFDHGRRAFRVLRLVMLQFLLVKCNYSVKILAYIVHYLSIFET